MKRIKLTHWGRVTHICVSKLTIIGSDNGLSPDRRQAIIWTNAGSLLIGPLGTIFSEIWIEIHTFSFNKIHLKMSSAKWRPLCLGLNVLTRQTLLLWPVGRGWLLVVNRSCERKVTNQCMAKCWFIINHFVTSISQRLTVRYIPFKDTDYLSDDQMRHTASWELVSIGSAFSLLCTRAFYKPLLNCCQSHRYGRKM